MADRHIVEPFSYPLIDTHAHLELDPLYGDIDGVMERARAAGIGAIVTVGIDPDDAKRALEVAHRFDNVFVSLGFHPHNAKDVGNGGLTVMDQLARDPKVVAYGEIGLDFFRDHSPHAVQRAVFADQLELAKTLDKPVVIHLRDAYKEGMAMLETAAPFPRGGVIHCFSGDESDADKAVELGFHISIPGTITYKNNDRFRSILQTFPAEGILLETDCPFLAPEPRRGRDNEPSLMVYTARKVAEIRGVDEREIARLTTKNAIEFFGLPRGIAA